jgi:hypothetical protein
MRGGLRHAVALCHGAKYVQVAQLEATADLILRVDFL